MKLTSKYGINCGVQNVRVMTMRVPATLARTFAVKVVDEKHEAFGRYCYCELFSLHYSISNVAFMIEDIEVTVQNEGYGRKLVETIWQYCERHELHLYANLVLSEAVGFWLALGFVQDQADPMNFVRRYGPRAA